MFVDGGVLHMKCDTKLLNQNTHVDHIKCDTKLLNQNTHVDPCCQTLEMVFFLGTEILLEGLVNKILLHTSPSFVIHSNGISISKKNVISKNHTHVHYRLHGVIVVVFQYPRNIPFLGTTHT